MADAISASEAFLLGVGADLDDFVEEDFIAPDEAGAAEFDGAIAEPLAAAGDFAEEFELPVALMSDDFLLAPESAAELFDMLPPAGAELVPEVEAELAISDFLLLLEDLLVDAVPDASGLSVEAAPAVVLSEDAVLLFLDFFDFLVVVVEFELEV